MPLTPSTTFENLALGWVQLHTGKFRAVLQMRSAIHHLATDLLEEVREQSAESCRWSAKLQRPTRILLGSRRCVWMCLKRRNGSIGYRQFCRRTQRGTLGVERAQQRHDYDKN